MDIIFYDESNTYGVEGGRATLEATETAHSLETTGGLVRNHTTNSAEENSSGSSVVERTLLGVSVHALTEEVSPEHLVTEE